MLFMGASILLYHLNVIYLKIIYFVWVRAQLFMFNCGLVGVLASFILRKEFHT